MNFVSAAAAGGQPMSLGMLGIYIVGIVAFMYFVMIRPQKKQEKEHRAVLESIAVGDYVLTSSGFYGEIIDITDDMVIVEFGSNKNCRIPMQKGNIVRAEKPGE